MFVLRTGLKKSNYSIGRLEFSRSRIRSAVNAGTYEAVLYEYFHAVDSVGLFREAGVPAILDMHNLLWKSLEQRFDDNSTSPAWFKSASVHRYRRRENPRGKYYDALIAINRREYDVVQARLRPSQKLFYAPMGTDLSAAFLLAASQASANCLLRGAGQLGGTKRRRFAVVSILCR